MQDVSQALAEVKGLYERVLGKPAPEIQPGSYLTFPPGVDPLDHAVHEVRQLRQLSEQITFPPSPTAFVPPADCFSTDDAFVVRVEIPGVARETLKVFVTGGECVVRGERKAPDTTDLRPLAIERPWGPFERRFALPAGSKTDAMEARYREGILELRVATEEKTIPGPLKVEVD